MRKGWEERCGLLVKIDFHRRTVVARAPRSGELRMQKLKFHLVGTQSLNVLPFTPGVGQYIAIHATLTARDLFRAYFYPSGPFNCFFPQNLYLFPCWLWLTLAPVQAPRIK